MKLVVSFAIFGRCVVPSLLLLAAPQLIHGLVQCVSTLSSFFMVPTAGAATSLLASLSSFFIMPTAEAAPLHVVGGVVPLLTPMA